MSFAAVDAIAQASPVDQLSPLEQVLEGATADATVGVAAAELAEVVTAHLAGPAMPEIAEPPKADVVGQPEAGMVERVTAIEPSTRDVTVVTALNEMTAVCNEDGTITVTLDYDTDTITVFE